jgi:hypothetical protein
LLVVLIVDDWGTLTKASRQFRIVRKSKTNLFRLYLVFERFVHFASLLQKFVIVIIAIVMPPKKAIAFGKIGSFGQLTISSNTQPAKSDSGDGGFGKFGKSDEEFRTEPTTAVQQAMGFQGFGKNKAAPVKQFDLESLVEQSKQVARERTTRKVNEKEDATEEPEEDDEDVIGPPLPPPVQTTSKESEQLSNVLNASKKSSKKPTKSHSDDEDDDDNESSDSDDAENVIPASLEVTLNHGTKPVSALSVDHSGARLISGSVDYDVKLWDFAGMSSSLQSFRSIRPCER